VNDRTSVFSVVLVRSCPLLGARSATRHEGRERSAVRKTVVMARHVMGLRAAAFLKRRVGKQRLDGERAERHSPRP
jgi:hypothetical protein